MVDVHPGEPHRTVDTIPSVDRFWIPGTTPIPPHARLPTPTAPSITSHVSSLGRFQHIGGDLPQPPAAESHLQPRSSRDTSQSFNLPDGGHTASNTPRRANVPDTNFPRPPTPAQSFTRVPKQANLGTTPVRDTFSITDRRCMATDIKVAREAARTLLGNIETPRHLSAILSYLQLDDDCWGKVWDVSCPEKQCNRDAILRLWPELAHLPGRLAYLIWNLRVLPGWPHIQMELLEAYQSPQSPSHDWFAH